MFLLSVAKNQIQRRQIFLPNRCRPKTLGLREDEYG